MATIVEHKPHNVTLGVLDKNLRLHEDLQSVTYQDHNGTAHTVYAHVNGPFGDAEAIIAAHQSGILHTFESHDAALAHWADQGDTDFVERLEKVIGDARRSGAPSTGAGV